MSGDAAHCGAQKRRVLDDRAAEWHTAAHGRSTLRPARILAIAVAKFGGGAVSGSVAMFAEGVHSFVDTVNQILLLVGIRRAARAADDMHPFGYGREVYFFAFVVALFIFLGGGVFAIYEGWHKIHHPDAEGSATIAGYVIPGFWLNVVILSFAIATEGYSGLVALRAFRAEAGGSNILRSIRRSKNSSLFTVLLEDAAAVVGLCIAILGVVLARVLDMPALDGVRVDRDRRAAGCGRGPAAGRDARSADRRSGRPRPGCRGSRRRRERCRCASGA